VDPPHFRAGSEEKRCETCQCFLDETPEWGRCRLYDRSMRGGELCDSWSAKGVLVWEKGKRRA
jgi:hypothetical protein